MHHRDITHTCFAPLMQEQASLPCAVPSCAAHLHRYALFREWTSVGDCSENFTVTEPWGRLAWSAKPSNEGERVLEERVRPDAHEMCA